MGALHGGHLSLVEKSNKTCQNTVVSIYLNPTQFAPTEDLDSYPKNIKKDIHCVRQTPACRIIKVLIIQYCTLK